MQLPATARRVELNTDEALNDAIRARTEAEVVRRESASGHEIAERLRELDDEWDVERLLQVNALTLVIIGVLLGTKVDRRFLLLPAAVFAFFGQHALQAWCPPIPIFRRLGVRTHRVIVGFLDPQTMVQLTNNAAVEVVANDAAARLLRVQRSLEQGD